MRRFYVAVAAAALLIAAAASFMQFTNASPTVQGGAVGSAISIEALTLRAKDLPVMVVDDPI